MTNGIVYELAPQSPDRGVKNTGRGEAKRNPCKKEPPTKQSAEGTTEILSPLSGLQYVPASYAGVPLRCTTCLCSYRPFGTLPLPVFSSSFRAFAHLPVFSLSLWDFAHLSVFLSSLRDFGCLLKSLHFIYNLRISYIF